MPPHRSTPRSTAPAPASFTPSPSPPTPLDFILFPTTSPAPAVVKPAAPTHPGRRPTPDRDEKLKARIVRNRLAAQASRDKKRQQLEDLERENAGLRARVAELEKALAAATAPQPNISTVLDGLDLFASLTSLNNTPPPTLDTASLLASLTAFPASTPAFPTPPSTTSPTFTTTSSPTFPFFPSPTHTDVSGEPAAFPADATSISHTQGYRGFFRGQVVSAAHPASLPPPCFPVPSWDRRHRGFRVMGYAAAPPAAGLRDPPLRDEPLEAPFNARPAKCGKLRR
ncbi:hypothetical protein HDU96_005685 [Phlyctochytrium bullatum]|nr:hypothetical protein HDU96_005685 [Phlyctochytrium bullatum]